MATILPNRLAFLASPRPWPPQPIKASRISSLGATAAASACGVIAAIGLTLLTHAYRFGEASVVTPFEYTGLLWSVIYGVKTFLWVDALKLVVAVIAFPAVWKLVGEARG